MPRYSIVIINGAATSYTEEHASIAAARTAAIYKALHQMLEEPSSQNTLAADCSIIEARTNSELSFTVKLSIRDHI